MYLPLTTFHSCPSYLATLSSLLSWMVMVSNWICLISHSIPAPILVYLHTALQGRRPGLGRAPGRGHGNQSSIVTWRIPMDRVAMGSQRAGHDWAANTFFFTTTTTWASHTESSYFSKPGSDFSMNARCVNINLRSKGTVRERASNEVGGYNRKSPVSCGLKNPSNEGQ